MVYLLLLLSPSIPFLYLTPLSPSRPAIGPTILLEPEESSDLTGGVPGKAATESKCNYMTAYKAWCGVHAAVYVHGLGSCDSQFTHVHVIYLRMMYCMGALPMMMGAWSMAVLLWWHVECITISIHA